MGRVRRPPFSPPTAFAQDQSLTTQKSSPASSTESLRRSRFHSRQNPLAVGESARSRDTGRQRHGAPISTGKSLFPGFIDSHSHTIDGLHPSMPVRTDKWIDSPPASHLRGRRRLRDQHARRHPRGPRPALAFGRTPTRSTATSAPGPTRNRPSSFSRAWMVTWHGPIGGTLDARHHCQLFEVPHHRPASYFRLRKKTCSPTDFSSMPARIRSIASCPSLPTLKSLLPPTPRSNTTTASASLPGSNPAPGNSGPRRAYKMLADRGELNSELMLSPKFSRKTRRVGVRPQAARLLTDTSPTCTLPESRSSPNLTVIFHKPRRT